MKKQSRFRSKSAPRAIVALTFLISLSSPCFSECKSGTFSLRGKVVDGVSGNPLTDVRVGIWGPEWEEVPTVAPDADGQFTFTGLAPCSYVLQAILPNDTVAYGELPDSRSMPTVTVGPGEADKVLLFRVQPHSVLTGTVRDESGEPVEHVHVEVYRPTVDRGRIRLVSDSFATTDDLGQFRIDGLRPGNYVVCAEPPIDSSRYTVPVDRTAFYQAGATVRFYTRSCFPASYSQPSYLRIESGDQPSIDLTLGSAPGVKIRARILPLPGTHSGHSLSLIREDDIRSVISNVPEQNGFLVFPALAGGRYFLEGRIDDSPRHWVARRYIEVPTQSPAPIELTPEPLATVEVHVRGLDRHVPDSGSAAVDFLPTAPGLQSQARTESVFTLDPGTYWVSIRAHEPFCTASARLDGQEVFRKSIAVSPGMRSSLDVDLTTQCGSIDLKAFSDGKPTPNASFALLISGTVQDPGDVYLSDFDGEIAGLAAGRYLIWSWLPDQKGFIGPSLEEASRHAVEVLVTAGQTTPVLIRPILPSGGAK